MELVNLMEIVKDEKEAEKFLREKDILKTFVSCPYCGINISEKSGEISTNVKRNGV